MEPPRPNQARPTRPTYLTHLTYLPIQLTRPPDLTTHLIHPVSHHLYPVYNLPEKTDNLLDIPTVQKKTDTADNYRQSKHIRQTMQTIQTVQRMQTVVIIKTIQNIKPFFAQFDRAVSQFLRCFGISPNLGLLKSQLQN